MEENRVYSVRDRAAVGNNKTRSVLRSQLLSLKREEKSAPASHVLQMETEKLLQQRPNISRVKSSQLPSILNDSKFPFCHALKVNTFGHFLFISGPMQYCRSIYHKHSRIKLQSVTKQMSRHTFGYSLLSKHNWLKC